ncbi:efflux RND transporter periplasmic adaptor subunit [Rickettsia typhi]|uniref:Efflux transporter n=2 Tax=Rickettsia typhi TaxID=785 RepID=A0ABM5MU38_RICTP|nr:efflux RND transporter periplasmic adaptor subunit [Rickettsia typhi]AAU03811.1 probable efflux transporter [Rickettsia typhi str. Wilmington]AFE54188.1 efflux transporter [Rickettsia typhi str. TH1527]AFE55028.1 efflux transporter [Rickettsia typhi str. B9991CWPP]
MHVKLIIPIILFMSLSTIANKKEEEKIIEVKVTKIQTTKLYDIFNVVGQCKNDNSRDYYANTAGVVEKVSAQQGKIVKKGDILLVIDQNIAETTKSRAAALLNTKQEDYNRKEALFAKKFISNEAYKMSKSALEDAKFNYAKSLKIYNDMIITAPYSGKIGIIKYMVGDEVKIGDYLFSITGTENTQSIFIELPESLSEKVHCNTEVLIAGKIKSTIDTVSHYLSEYGTFTAKIILPIGTKILHNSFVDVQLIINPHQNLTIPESCIQRNNQGHFIYKIVDGNTVKQVYVQIGTRTEGRIEITANDIKEGDLVVIEGMTKINDGSKVKIFDE